MKIFTQGKPGYAAAVKRIAMRMETIDPSVGRAVEKIIAAVRRDGDRALFAYTKKFDGAALSPKTVRVSEREFDWAFKSTGPKVVASLELAARRIREFHERQREQSWSVTSGGAAMGQMLRPLASAGVYVPGGKASYPSSALMNIIPARIAGVGRVVMVTPAPRGELNHATLVAARLAGADEVYKVGGAQAVAALAYGTRSVAPVDKIVGPGNAYVAEAKRRVFGKVDIDMIAGPSEILVLADDSADPAVIAADLLSQAEHDENAWPLLVATSAAVARAAARETAAQVKALPRRKIAEACLKRHGHCFVVKDLDEAFRVANLIAPEHLELLIRGARDGLARVENAGAVFAGPWTPEALGDYMAGPNHVLPTGGAARFSSPLGVYDFVKRTSALEFTREAFEALAEPVMALAELEGLTAHARAVAVRMRR
ncbi:MAG: histidinol dehydrogenase [Nitrospinae bacterium]|nr:histidinol dehydrogenase [Nitrospinota bacterium]